MYVKSKIFFVLNFIQAFCVYVREIMAKLIPTEAKILSGILLVKKTWLLKDIA